MNDQLQAELAAWLSKLREAADAGASFALEQAPLIVQEKVAYGRVSETFLWLTFVLLLVLAAWLGRRAHHWNDRYDHPLGYFGAAVFGVIGAIGVLAQAHAVAQVWFAPRLYVLEWLAGLLK